MTKEALYARKHRWKRSVMKALLEARAAQAALNMKLATDMGIFLNDRGLTVEGILRDGIDLGLNKHWLGEVVAYLQAVETVSAELKSLFPTAPFEAYTTEFVPNAPQED